MVSPQRETHCDIGILGTRCAVQRSARRSEQIHPDRVSLLDGIGFDWDARTGQQ